ncbi:hypothetical protein BWI96_10075 [Siphonobacter sp. SORGH_AS_0500]|uniref:alpha/beta hydrolase n=1 Tax=Siphonobacter sp. SORGH_AS_0500 TaxID=1864824 RepID=UPI000CB09904|nr:alpha/beta hydrolase [Siphonobacter sp. SORGH_AS_0500]PKK36719.1 hypothetical protein BWI96_10075 [Siphonobacter sp. SORGH_AS_0500]
MEKLNVTESRKALVDAARQWATKEQVPINLVVNQSIDETLQVRIYRNNEAVYALPVLIFLHGGGWLRGDLDTHDDVCRRLASDGSFMVIAVDYRLAPEHVFPAAVDDAFTAFQWILDNAKAINADAQNIAVCGDSSGGNLALALAQKAKENNRMLKGIAVAYPPLNYDFETSSYQQFADGYGLTKDLMKWLWDRYLGDADTGENRFASVLKNNFEHYPPTLIIASDEDPLRDDGRQLFEKMLTASVAVTYSFYPNTRHAFLLQTSVEKAAKVAQQEIIDFLKNKVFIA